tara:strand:- start:56 stop:709 length:654 start_codon:yes stop_codon:yes gene_type:complete
VRVCIICFEPGAGGKFLSFIGGVSCDAHLQDGHLFHLTPRQKKDLLAERLRAQREYKLSWNDLALGDDLMYARNDVDFLFDATVGDKWTFRIAHNAKQFERYMQERPDSLSVGLKHGEAMLKHRHMQVPEFGWFDEEYDVDLIWDWRHNVMQSAENLYNLLALPDFAEHMSWIAGFHKAWLDVLKHSPYIHPHWKPSNQHLTHNSWNLIKRRAHNER